MNIIIKSEMFTPEGIAEVEGKYDALFVCDTCLKNRDGGWINQPVAVFWNRDLLRIPEGGSAYFGLFHQWYPPDFKNGMLMITNAISAAENGITGIQALNGDIIYSRFRHDYRRSPDGTVWIDGGRDYVRTGSPGFLVPLQIKDGVLCVI